MASTCSRSALMVTRGTAMRYTGSMSHRLSRGVSNRHSLWALGYWNLGILSQDGNVGASIKFFLSVRTSETFAFVDHVHSPGVSFKMTKKKNDLRSISI